MSISFSGLNDAMLEGIMPLLKRCQTRRGTASGLSSLEVIK